jgi:hypothetical protein
MLHLLADDDDWAARSQRCITLGKSRSMAWEMDCAVNAMAYCLGGGTLDDLPVPELSYAALPFLAPVDDTPSVAAWCRAQHALASLRGVG